jgi:hypothetical protein
MTTYDIENNTGETFYVPYSVRDAVAHSLDNDTSTDVICLEPRMFNPFLRCIEAMRGVGYFQLAYTVKDDPYYQVRNVWVLQ